MLIHSFFWSQVNYKIVDGQFYRLFSAMFLHWDFYHLLANMFALYIFGRDIETIFGKSKFLTIYFFSGLTGSLFSFIFNNSIFCRCFWCYIWFIRCSFIPLLCVTKLHTSESLVWTSWFLLQLM